MKNLYIVPILLLPLLVSACNPGQEAEAVETARARLVGTTTAEAEIFEIGTMTAAAATEAVINRQAELTKISARKTESAGERYAHATEVAQTLYSQIISLHEQGLISTTEGAYRPLEDTDATFAQIDWFIFNSFGLRKGIRNFVISADVDWKVASDSANQSSSGCGYGFRHDGDDSFYVAFLTLDGNVTLLRRIPGQYDELGKNHYGKVGFRSGEANLMLAVDGSKFTFFVNGEKVITVTDETLEDGELLFTVHSGINTDYGTKCSLSNIELWVIDGEN